MKSVIKMLFSSTAYFEQYFHVDYMNLCKLEWILSALCVLESMIDDDDIDG